MTVKELIAELQKYDENIAVKIFDSEWGYLDVEEARHAKGSHIDRAQGVRIDYNYIAIS